MERRFASGQEPKWWSTKRVVECALVTPNRPRSRRPAGPGSGCAATKSGLHSRRRTWKDGDGVDGGVSQTSHLPISSLAFKGLWYVGAVQNANPVSRGR
ncbi:unnamed protein product [Protopolystoma xenopodis]|uniref:Uncharacterized protein n=1 Tax=Protopolystoma xenopodis TaxID=117903 RepID=A0A448X5T2_9PLAT|nr:unnamed protein product [Protopolystoma xenopodis]